MYNIRNLKIKSNKDYLATGSRKKYTASIRTDLFNNFDNFAKKTKVPKSKCLDILIYLALHDEDTRAKFIKLLKEY